MESRKWMGPREIAQILGVTDAMGLHREAIRVPLDCEDAARLEIVQRVLVIVVPSTGTIDEFVIDLPSRIKSLPGAHLLKRSEAPPQG